MKTHADIVKNKAIGIPSISAALIVNGIKPSETIQVTGGTPENVVS